MTTKPMPSLDVLGTIGKMRAHGIEGIEVICDNQFCQHAKRISFEKLGLSDVSHFAVVRQKQFVCTICGGHRHRIMPDWRNYRTLN
jgi:hypothetical protein